MIFVAAFCILQLSVDQSRAVDLAKALLKSKDADVKPAGLELTDGTRSTILVRKQGLSNQYLRGQWVRKKASE